MEHTTQEYRESISQPDTDDMFSLAYQWQDKPHRHVFDLCNEIDRQQSRIEELERENAKLKKEIERLNANIKTHQHVNSMNEMLSCGYDANRTVELERENAELNNKIEALRRFYQGQLNSLEQSRPLRPDHRDKQREKDCLACEIETLKRQVEAGKLKWQSEMPKSPFKPVTVTETPIWLRDGKGNWAGPIQPPESEE